ncbi:MAG: LacI family DNA-binding transcriptional regulator, partial [Bacilli bacterium]
MIKVKDIAKKCGVSTATVSKALHNSKELKEETIAYICKTAKDLGYIPNASARALKLKKSYSIGVLFVDKTGSGLQHEYFSSMLDSVKTEAESRGYDVTFISQNITNEDMSYLEHARYRNVDGVVIASVDFHDEQVIKLVNSEIPTVTIDYIYNCSTAIMSDNTNGLYDLVKYAASMGHKKIAFVHGETTDVTSKRLAGYYKAHQDLNLKVKQSYLITSDYHDPKGSGQATKKLLSEPVVPTCIIYPDDISLIGGMTALQQAGYKIPEDMSVIGYDGVNISRILRPIVTTYVQDSKELGRQAVIELVARIE